MLGNCKQFLDTRPQSQIIALGFALLILVSILDHHSGAQFSLKVLYLLPVVLVTWYAHVRAGIVFCFLCAIVSVLTDYYIYKSTLMLLFNLFARLGFYYLTLHVFMRLKTSLEREKVLASTDALTSLLNRRSFTDLSRQLMELAARYHHATVLAYIDIDDFKTVNDTLGHAEGDRVLTTVSNTLTRCVRATDVVGRLGGDEFAIFLPETDFAGAQKLFEKLREDLTRESIKNGWPIGFSIGVALFPGITSATNIDKALEIADDIMYRIKKAGKNNIAYEVQSVSK